MGLALTVYQPWASLLACGVKRYETRPLPPGGLNPSGVRGYPGKKVAVGDRLHIHAGGHVPSHIYELLGSRFGDELRAVCAQHLEGFSPHERHFGLPTGRLLSSHRLAGAYLVVSPETAPFAEAGPDHQVIEHDGDRLYLWPSGESLTSERALGDFRPGRWAWALDELEAIDDDTPVPGHQGIWVLPDAA